jgi:hypothetical protein
MTPWQLQVEVELLQTVGKAQRICRSALDERLWKRRWLSPLLSVGSWPNGMPQLVRTNGNPSVASLTTGDTTVASLATDDSCVALRTAGNSPSASHIIGDLTKVSVGSAHVASAHIDSARVASARPSVSAPNPKAKKEGEVEKLRKDEGRESCYY